jgi:alkyldihydroxyacetonephosphate synthase
MMKWWGWGSVGKEYPVQDKPDLFPFMKKMCGIDESTLTPPIRREEILLAPPRLNEAFLKDLKTSFRADQYASDDETRLLHTYGKSYRDLLRVRAGKIERSPDGVLYPENHQEVISLMKLADQHGIPLVTFGGGSNIVGGVEVDPRLEGMAITVDLQRMKNILSFDPSSRSATIEGGILGPELEAKLNARGFSLGHFPDSFEFSTLGGWLATRSAGMQSDRYGKIEDMVLSLKLVSPAGVLETPLVPKASTGPDLNQVVVGSEGTLGVITQATMKIHPKLPAEYRGLLFPNFESGAGAIRDCMHEDCMPETMRLSNDDETAFGFAMRSEAHSSWLKKRITEAMMGYLKKVKKFDFSKVCLVIMGFEGSPREIRAKHKAAMRVCKRYQGVDLGTSVGNKWFSGKYDYPYLRDFFMNYGGMVDVTETSVLWPQVVPMHEKVKEKLKAYLQGKNYPGYVGCHLSHSYPSGACLYFTFGVKRIGGKELEQYLGAKKTVVEAILECGGALSHHHAIGYEHLPWYSKYTGETGLKALRALKKALDPKGICNPNKLIPQGNGSLEHYWPKEIITSHLTQV